MVTPTPRDAGTLTLVVRVTPRAKHDVIKLQDGQLRVWLRAAPVDGAANAALIALLAERLNLPRRAITIIHGETARLKRLAIEGLSADGLRQRLTAVDSA
jgi:uncharacterized protein